MVSKVGTSIEPCCLLSLYSSVATGSSQDRRPGKKVSLMWRDLELWLVLQLHTVTHQHASLQAEVHIEVMTGSRQVRDSGDGSNHLDPDLMSSVNREGHTFDFV